MMSWIRLKKSKTKNNFFLLLRNSENTFIFAHDFGRLTQLVQSASLTRRKSGVRVPHCPPKRNPSHLETWFRFFLLPLNPIIPLSSHLFYRYLLTKFNEFKYIWYYIRLYNISLICKGSFTQRLPAIKWDKIYEEKNLNFSSSNSNFCFQR